MRDFRKGFERNQKILIDIYHFLFFSSIQIKEGLKKRRGRGRKRWLSEEIVVRTMYIYLLLLLSVSHEHD